jgi:hypothetical protein
MGTVISFPALRRGTRASASSARRSEPATVVILPVIRIERYVEPPLLECEPEASRGPRRRRRRRANRS